MATEWIVGEPLENSLAQYFPVAPFGARHSVVTVSQRRGGRWLCHTCYEKPGTCRHITAVQDHLAAHAAGTRAAPVAAEAAA